MDPNNAAKAMNLFAKARTFQNFPKPGVTFIDFFSLISDPKLREETLGMSVDRIRSWMVGKGVTVVAGLEMRGVVLGVMIAERLGLRFVAIRKKNKLPGEKFVATYTTEYSTDSIELQHGSLVPGDRVLLVDDLLATGGTLNAATDLVRQSGAQVAGFFCLYHIKALGGPKNLDQEAEYIDLYAIE